MTIAFEIPHDIEQQIRAEAADLNRDVKEVSDTMPCGR